MAKPRRETTSAPPDAGGHRGTRTRPRDVLEAEDPSRAASPLGTSDPRRGTTGPSRETPRPGRNASIVRLLIGAMLVAVVLAWVFGLVWAP